MCRMYRVWAAVLDSGDVSTLDARQPGRRVGYLMSRGADGIRGVRTGRVGHIPRPWRGSIPVVDPKRRRVAVRLTGSA